MMRACAPAWWTACLPTRHGCSVHAAGPRCERDWAPPEEGVLTVIMLVCLALYACPAVLHAVGHSTREE